MCSTLEYKIRCWKTRTANAKLMWRIFIVTSRVRVSNCHRCDAPLFLLVTFASGEISIDRKFQWKAIFTSTSTTIELIGRLENHTFSSRSARITQDVPPRGFLKRNFCFKLQQERNRSTFPFAWNKTVSYFGYNEKPTCTVHHSTCAYTAVHDI